jgi:hypothetical protein
LEKHMTLQDQLQARRAKEQELRKHKDLVVESVRTHLLPAFIQRGFTVAPSVRDRPTDRKSAGTFPIGQLRRSRPDGRVDVVEIQFSTYQRAAFRINAGVAPKDGLVTLTGHRPVEEIAVHWLNEYFETHARPWLRPGLRALGLEPLGEWFSLPFWHFRSPNQADYDTLAARVAGLVPEIELALSEGKLGPHIRKVVIPRGRQRIG